MSIFSSSTWNKWRTKVETGTPDAGVQPEAATSSALPSSPLSGTSSPSRHSGSPRSRRSSGSPATSKRNSLSLSDAARAPGSPSRQRRKTVTDGGDALERERMKEEYDRRIRVLSSCLETKAEENITLNEQLEKANRRLVDMEAAMKEMSALQFKMTEMQELLSKRESHAEGLAEALSTAELDLLQAKDAAEEYERRVQVLSTCLEEMASENMLLRSSTSDLSGSGEEKQLATSSSDAPAQESGAVHNFLQNVVHQDMEVAHKLREELETTKKALSTAEKRIVTLNTKLMENVNKKMAAEESNEMYEEKLKSLEKEMMDNLHQEGIRRQEAEYVVSKLRKKVAELQFLLDERDQGSSDEDYDSDD